MLSEILLSLNWVDLVMGCIFIRCIYIGCVKGIVVEIFKTLGIFFAAFVILHYFGLHGQKIHEHFAIPLGASEIIAFLFVWLSITIVFAIIRIGLSVFFKTEPNVIVDKIGGVLLALFRGCVICSLIFVLFYLSGQSYIVKNADNAFSRFYLANVGPRFYENSYNLVVVKLFPKEVKHSKALELIKKKKKSKK